MTDFHTKKPTSSIRLKVENLSKSYGAFRAIDSLQFSVSSGSLSALIGPNGAGKSTTMRIIAGIQRANSGTIALDGEEIQDKPARAKMLISLTPQELALFDYLTGEETLRFVGKVRGMKQDNMDERISHWLSLTHLDSARNKIVREYSGGMKRKLAIAAAFISEPKLVLLDESFTGLDPESTFALQQELREYCKRGGSILLSSHILDMVQNIADEVILVAKGKHVRTLRQNELQNALATEGSLTEIYLACLKAAKHTH